MQASAEAVPPPEAPSAPATGPRVVVMRHSSRLDHTQHRKGVTPEWVDSKTRPHDSPIDDWELPRAIAQQYGRHAAMSRLPRIFLAPFRLSHHASPTALILVSLNSVIRPPPPRRLVERGVRITKVWSSPYRRCLQTAAAASAVMGVATVHTHTHLGEALAYVQEHALRAGLDPTFAFTGEEPMYLSREEKQAAVGADMSVVDVVTAHVEDERGSPHSRMVACVKEILRQHAEAGEEGDILVVSHWDAVYAVAAEAGAACSPDYCGTVVLDAEMTTVLHSFAVQHFS